jgi:hypothetical protein
MTLEAWDIDHFPLTAEAAGKTPGQRSADDFLRAVTPDDIERLIREHQPDERDRDFGVSTSGGGHETQTYTPYGQGYNAEGRRYPGEYPEGYSGHNRPDYEYSNAGARPSDYEDFYNDDDDEDYENNGEDYHIVTRPRDAIHGLNVFNEHNYHPFGRHYTGTGESAMNMFAEDHPEYDTERYPDSATHEVVDAHLADDHDHWHRNLSDEDETFNRRIAPTGLRRESPDVPGHRAYRYEEPNGVVHRLWRSTYSSNGPGWHTSRHDPRLERDQQPVPWTEHPDSVSEDSLGDALAQIAHNRSR